MIQYLLQEDLWTFEDERHVFRLVFYGSGYVVCPGDANTWHLNIERYFKTIAYTSECNIDWDYTYIISRGPPIERGIEVRVDPWLYKKLKS